MRLLETFHLPASITSGFDKDSKWNGEIKVYELGAREYIQAQSEATSIAIEEYTAQQNELPEAQRQPWNGVIPEDIMRVCMTCKAVKVNGQALNPRDEIPAKIYEALSLKVLPKSTLSKAEWEALFLSSAKNEKAPSAFKSTS